MATIRETLTETVTSTVTITLVSRHTETVTTTATVTKTVATTVAAAGVPEDVARRSDVYLAAAAIVAAVLASAALGRKT